MFLGRHQSNSGWNSESYTNNQADLRPVTDLMLCLNARGVLAWIVGAKHPAQVIQDYHVSAAGASPLLAIREFHARSPLKSVGRRAFNFKNKRNCTLASPLAAGKPDESRRNQAIYGWFSEAMGPVIHPPACG
jgi:hypothetical protein